MCKPKILVHICCAPDALYVMDILNAQFETAGFFYNPNIHPYDEYLLRLKETKKVAEILGFSLINGEYNDKEWMRITEKYRDEPEKGLRCDICYALRIRETAKKASSLGFDYYTTVMSLSPFKKADVLNRIGKMFGARFSVGHHNANFKKKDGFKKSIELSHKHKLYRQNFCGCLFSRQ